MEKEKLGNVLLYSMGRDDQPPSDEDGRLLEQIVQGCAEEEYHSRITESKNWTAMYQLAESRANLVEWLHLPNRQRCWSWAPGAARSPLRC